MDFLARHFEKLILGLALVGLLASCYFLLHSLKVARDNVRDVQEKSDIAVVEGKRIESLRDKKFTETKLTDPAQLALGGEEGGGSLFEPMEYIRCVNPRCPFLLPFKLNTCPYCRAAQPPVDPKGPDVGEDTDEDGLPDFFESRHSLLDPRDPTDAGRDSDRDGFTNIEEYKSEPRTKIEDPTDYPPLARNLRFLKVFRKPLPILLRGVTTNNSDDAAKWDISCYAMDRGKQRSKLLRIGDKVVGYELVKALYKTEEQVNPRTKLKQEVDVSELTIKQEDGDATYTLITGQKAYESDLNVTFFFLSNRYSPRSCLRFSARIGSEIRLPHRPSRQIQHYKVLDIAEDAVVVKRVDEGAEPQEFTIGKVNPRRDFLKADTTGTSNREGMRGGAMGMEPDEAMPGGMRR